MKMNSSAVMIGFLSILTGFSTVGAAEKEMWYGADGEIVRAVKSSEAQRDAWQPQWVAREAEQANPTRARSDYRSWNRGWSGNGLYVGRSIYVPRAFYGYAGCTHYGGSSYYGGGTRGGFSGFYSNTGGHSSYGATYQRPGCSLRFQR